MKRGNFFVNKFYVECVNLSTSDDRSISEFFTVHCQICFYLEFEFVLNFELLWIDEKGIMHQANHASFSQTFF